MLQCLLWKMMERSLRRIVRDNWVMLASIAWQGYQTKGRGCVVIDQPDADDSFVQYWPADILRGMTEEDNSDPDFAMLDRYEPQTEMIVGFMLPERSLELWRVAARDYGITPPEAFEEWRNNPY